jgi:hypothetical protein
MREYIRGAIPENSVRSHEIFTLDIGRKSFYIDLLNFTDIDVNAVAVDVERCTEAARRVCVATMAQELKLKRAKRDELAEEERVNAEAALSAMEQKIPSLAQQAVEREVQQGRFDLVELIFNDGASRLILKGDGKVRLALFPCPGAVSWEKAQKHFYVLLLDKLSPVSGEVLAIEEQQLEQGLSEEALAELIREVRAGAGLDGSIDLHAALEHPLIFGRDSRQIMQGILKERNFLGDVEGFAIGL